MATVFYDKAAVEVTHNGVTEQLLATNCSLNFSNTQQPLYMIGAKGSLGQFPSSARVGNLSFDFLTTVTGEYFGQIGNLVNSVASGIKNSTSNGSEASGVTVKFAGVSGLGFLTDYSLSVASNTVSSSSAAFDFYGSGTQLPVSGRLTGVLGQQINTGVLTTGIAHGRYTNLNNFATVITAPSDGTEIGTVFSADYSLSLAHNPVYKIGQEFPMTCFYSSAQESVDIAEDVFNSGLKFKEVAQNLVMTVSGLGGSSGMEIGISGAQQVGTSMQVGIDDIVRTQKTLTAAY
jgi:hypothetical protein|tara:strand:+ start:1240 stop:2109 length:870 start_codon:yes stop_codon:yes gene_type:complete